jgi:hypothetical protein
LYIADASMILQQTTAIWESGSRDVLIIEHASSTRHLVPLTNLRLARTHAEAIGGLGMYKCVVVVQLQTV